MQKNTVTLKISSLIKSLKEFRNEGFKYVDISILESEFDEDFQENIPAKLCLEAYEELNDSDFAEEDFLSSLK